MDHPFSVKLTYKAKKGNWPALRGEIYEHDVRIATFQRGPVVDHTIGELTYKFFSDASKYRFMEIADCLFIPEIIEALMPDAVSQ